ncbi:MAG: ankyrin repeat domain-containing protein [Candidatus Kapabacteria bacterium]|nr:ankyrin repeat domain-containing protein [Candidatus Kapabacteria bacterium]
MKPIIIRILFFILLPLQLNCNRENPVDKSKLKGRDYRLFQNTVAWDLAKAVQDEDELKIKEIITKDPNIINYQDPKYGNTLLIFTIMNQQMEPFMVLINNKADINIHNTFDGSSALIEAVRLRDYDIKFAEILIKNGANVNDIETGERSEGNSTRQTPLISAVSSGKIEFVELLINNGADINYQNEYGQSAFGESVMTNEYKISNYLLQHGANYHRPVFFIPDDSVLFENRDPNDKGKPMYLVDVLRKDIFPLYSSDYQYKMQIVDFLKSKGIDYRATPVPEYIKERIKERYPNSWQEYLEKY